MKSSRPVEVEVLPPESASQTGGPTGGTYELIAHLMDRAFRVPGTNFRFGLDPILGLIPGAGDTIGGVISVLLLTQGLKAGAPKVVIARMALNIFLNTTIGAIPVVGDAFSFWFKSNTRNQELLRRASGTGRRSGRSDWIFVFGVMAVLLLVLGLVIAVIVGLAAEGMRVVGDLAR